jgi:hypothetical protein
MRREFFERQCQRQDGGSYLIRPHGRIGGIYEVDEPTKERHVATGILLGKAQFAFIIIAIPISQFLGVSLWYFAGAVLLLVVGSLIYTRRLLANALKVPATRWDGPAVADTFLMYPRWYLRAALVVGAIMTVVAGFAVFSELKSRHELSLGNGVLALLFAVGTGFFWYLLRRRARFERERPVAPPTGG